MPFKPGRQKGEPDYKRLLTTLNHSIIKDKDSPLYEVITRLIDYGGQSKSFVESEIQRIDQSIKQASSGGGGGGGNGGGTTPPVVMNGYYAPVTNGDGTYPEILFDSNGEVIMGWVSE